MGAIQGSINQLLLTSSIAADRMATTQREITTDNLNFEQYAYDNTKSAVNTKLSQTEVDMARTSNKDYISQRKEFKESKGRLEKFKKEVKAEQDLEKTAEEEGREYDRQREEIDAEEERTRMADLAKEQEDAAHSLEKAKYEKSLKKKAMKGKALEKISGGPKIEMRKEGSDNGK